MRLRNKIILSICLLFLIGIIINCGYNVWQKNIYNNDKEIAKEGHHYTYTNRIGPKNTNNKLNLEYSGFSGAESIWILKSKEDGEITFNYESTVKSGKFKAVLVNSKKAQVENILEGTEQGNKTIKVTEGDYVVKIVGKNAEGDINLSINENKNFEITNAD